MNPRPRAEAKRPRVAAGFIVDNSVWQRLSRPAVRAAMAQLTAGHSPWSILVCPPIAAEVGFSARDGADHDAVQAHLSAFPECETHPGTGLVLDIQNALWNGGLRQAVGAADTLIAAYAIANDATVVHYDSDFEHVERVRPDFRHRWIVPRGTVP